MKCPSCQREIEASVPDAGNAAGNAFRPFCSRRCKLIDLGRWIKGEYRVEGREPVAEEDGVEAFED
ncbi:MAG TPA: DNA gyrase inhibitor YacG [Terriglobia bacterium]|nr:DNA gyrase inhibitor YacG [Terriglobia bacterium]